ncbi:MAG: DUF2924 domain-containing protein [Steroidobacteraceae bacterium]|nr:DUF2924 domain-containing protein [Steroidobacteraceae bacterium]
MPTIEVDFDVYKAIIARRTTEDVSNNDVLRQLFHLGSREKAPEKVVRPDPGDLVIKGVRLPAGTALRATYKGQTHLARVANGALQLDGRSFGSVSAAAMHITGNPVNGWKFWHIQLPDQMGWRSLNSFREHINRVDRHT